MDSIDHLTHITRLLKPLVAGVDIKEGFQEFALELRNTFDFDRLVVALLDGDYFTYCARYSAPGIPQALAPDGRHPVKGSSLEWFKAHPEPHVCHDLSLQTPFWGDEALVKAGMRSIVRLPLFFKDQLVGSLAMSSHRPSAFSPENIRTLSALSSVVALAAQTGRLYEQVLNDREEARHSEEEVRQQLRQLAGLYSISGLASRSLEMEGLLQEALLKVMEVLKAEAGTIFLVDEERQKLVRVVSRNFPEEVLASLPELNMDGSLVGRTYRMGKVEIDADIMTQSAMQGFDMVIRAGFKSATRVPLRTRGRTSGVANFLSLEPAHFKLADVDFLASVGEILGAALENSNLVTGIRNSERQLRESEKGQVVLTIAAGIAHDFNNHLAVIMGNIEMAQRQPQTSEAAEYLEAARQASLESAGLIRGLSQIARPSSPTEMGAIDMNDVVRSVILLTSPRWKDEAQKEGNTINIVTDLAASAMVNGNSDELQEAITNLLLNAIEAIPHGGEILVRTLVKDRKTITIIRDSGVGIPKEAFSQLFTPFFTTKGPSSSGLGLAIARSIIRGHNGDISIDSRPGKGTQVTISLPMPAREKADAVRERTRPAIGRTYILLVDDEPTVGKVLKQMLEAERQDVDFETDPVRAVELFRQRRHNIVLTDLGMPAMNGWQLASKIKEISPRTPVVLTTGWAASITPEELREKCIDGCLHKPFDLAQILQTVNGLVPR